MAPLPRPELLTGVGGSKNTASSASNNNINSYGSIVDVERVPLTQMSLSDDSSLQDDEKKDIMKKTTMRPLVETKRILTIISVSLLVIMIVSALLYVVAPIFRYNHHPQNNHDNNSNNHKRDNNKNTFLLDPVNDLGLLSVKRQTDASPSSIWTSSQTKGPLPTNSWYLNLVSHKASQQPDESTSVYTVPYVIDTAAASSNPNIAAGIRVHWPVLQASMQNIQMVRDFKNSITLGCKTFGNTTTTTSITTTTTTQNSTDSTTPTTVHPYHVRTTDGQPLSPLGITLEWSTDDNENNSTNQDDVNTGKTRKGRLSKSTKPSAPDKITKTTNHPTTPTPPRMTTHIVRGMAYATMEYQGGVMPSLYSFNGLASDIRIDDDDDNNNNNTTTASGDNNNNSTTTTTTTTTLHCGTKKKESGNKVLVQNHLHLHFVNSDFTWMVFFSRPVHVTCTTSEGDEFIRDFQLDVVDIVDTDTDIPLTVRVALLDQCTTGKSNIQQHCQQDAKWTDPQAYERLLKKHVDIYPTNPQMQFQYPTDNDDTNKTTDISIDWGAKSSSKPSTSKSHTLDTLLLFALPHHQELLLAAAATAAASNHPSTTTSTSSSTTVTDYCTTTFHGRTCLVQGSHWTLSHDVGAPLSFWAPRPPQADMIPALATALAQDIRYRLSDNLMRGAADTYFSGKILARYARVVVIADELMQLADEDLISIKQLQKHYSINAEDGVDIESLQAARKAAKSVQLPTASQLGAAIQHLKHGVEAWLDSGAEAPFLFDETWGGLVNCGCRYVGKDEKGYCNNTFPDCPALVDVNEDFGNGYYNDHHYHYGYHLYAAAVAAKFDPAWARQHMDDVMLYIRDFANPMSDDPYFPSFRQKDWFLGSSWASGIVSAENSPHGRNEESSSEAISAYEAMALFGSAMVDAYAGTSDGSALSFLSGSSSKSQHLEIAKLVQQSGQLLTATELEATNRYWHVWNSPTHNSSYPEAYQQPVVGMLYDTMAMFGTWFSQWPLVSYGIQLLPLTPVAERRDDPEWAAILYPQYKKACQDAGDFCIENGWSILQAGLLATAGDRQGALDQAMNIPAFVYETQGGMGNSLTNLIWYIATRKQVQTMLATNETTNF
ncbi:glycosyl hydrolase family 81 protein [Nitzschia inconspicua]|uniref:glucan endo-1,3-beta-D-glucosidase n=1 Tax=Nitzschia inconspicua TaxID=303405 RepID=A0A9K3LVQ8_9STRA|nr:glycosyl hydrolase family 81 protein [Nitzschia inconspicua]